MAETRILIAHFSPTGTTVKVARAIARGTGCPVREVDLSAPVEPQEVGEEVLLAAMPVYGGRVPAVALERLAQLKGKGQKAVAVVVYGNRAYEDALLELKEALEKGGFQAAAAGAFVAEHSIVRTIAAGRPDAHDLEAAGAFGAAVMNKLAGGEEGPVQVPGNRAYKSYKGLPFHPKASKECVRCGTCAKLCPVGAIPTEDPSLTDEKRCITCMRCVEVCPQKARALPAPAKMAAAASLAAVTKEPRQPETFL